MLEMMSVDDCLKRLSAILNDEAYSNYLATTSAYQYQFRCNLLYGFLHTASLYDASSQSSSFAYTSKQSSELQRMFAYLLESERKAYNPHSFCRVYQMDHQPLNTGEQKDMAEFFIDLVSKLEEMTPDLKELVKRLFCGTLSNNVVSLDCDHVSRTAEEFYTVRCQVADMRNLQESLDEVTVKDTLEGDNMYTCSQCGKKVRAEKRACFKKLPQILYFNTMRYTFNMLLFVMDEKSGDSINMSPNNNHDPSENSNENVAEADLQEMAAVNDSLDELSTVLDFFEQRTDNIIEQLKELLHSNREIRQELALENAANAIENLNIEKPQK